MLKKTLSVLLAIVMVCGMVPLGVTQAFAAQTEADPVADGYPALTIGGSATAVFTEEGEEIIYQVNPSEGGVYSFYSTGENDTVAELFDGSWNSLVSNDDNDGSNFGFTQALEADKTYFLKLWLYSYKFDDDGKISVDLYAEKLLSADSLTITNGESESGYINQAITLDAELSPSNAVQEEITWTSSDNDIVSLDDDYTMGKHCDVYLIEPGTAVITASTSSGLSDTIEVTVKDYEAITLDTPVTVTTDSKHMVLFKFAPAVTGTYEFSSSGAENETYALIGEIYEDGYRSQLKTDYGNDDFSVSCRFEAGKTYYMGTRFYYSSGEGSYDVTLTKIPSATGMQIMQGEEITEQKGNYIDLSAIFTPEGSAPEVVNWSSSDGTVVSISENGSAHLIKEGSAVITAKSENGLEATCTITVTDFETISTGETKDISINTPRSAKTYKFVPDKDGTYSFFTSGGIDTLGYLYDENMYYLDENDDGGVNSNFRIRYELEAGKTYYIRAEIYSEGTGSFTLTAQYNPAATGLEIKQGDTVEGHPNDRKKLDAVFVPDGAIPEDITWSSSDEDTVSVDADGYIWLYKTGTATITAESESGLKATCTVTVKDYETLAAGETKSTEVPAGGSAVYKITPGEDNRYVLTATGNSRTAATLRNYEFDPITITSGNISELRWNLYGGETYYLDVNFQDEDASGPITVSAEETPGIADLQITSLPDQTTYVNGFTDEFDYTGLAVQATWSDGEVTNWTYGKSSSMRGEKVSISSNDATVTVSCCQRSASFEMETIDNPVAGVKVLNGLMPIIENTQGYWSTRYNPETHEYDIKFYYYQDFKTDNLEVQIDYLDGTSEIAGIGDKVNGYSVELYTNQYSKEWTVGSDNPVVVSYLGKTDTIYATVTESPVLSIEPLDTPAPIIENSGGRWESRYNGETGSYEDFWYYNELGMYDLPVLIHFKDGTTEEAEVGDKLNGYSISYTSYQYDKPFTLGSDNVAMITYMGCESPVNVTITESPVLSIELLGTPDPIIENTNGYWNDRYNQATDEYENFWHYDDLGLYGLPVRVHFKDGTTEDVEYGDEVRGQYFRYSTNQYDKPFTVGSDNPVTINLMGAEAIAQITITESPVESIEVLNGFSLTLIENVDGYWDTRYNPVTDSYDIDFFYYRSNGIEKADVRVNFKDGTSTVVHPYQEIDGNAVRVNSDQYNTPFTVGGNNYFTVSYLGAEDIIPVTIAPNPVRDIELVSATQNQYIENDDGWFEEDKDGHEFFEYNEGDISDAVIKINYTDGTSKTANVSSVVDGYRVEYHTNQYTNHWTLGSNNFITISYMGNTVDMPVTVIPTPLAGITINSAPTRVYIMGDSTYGTGQYFTPSDITGLNFTANFKDGTSKTYSYTDLDKNGRFDGHRYTVTAKDEQKIGDNPVRFTYMGAEAEYTVPVVDNPVAKFEVIKPPANPVFSQYYTPDWRGMQVKLTKKDGTTKTLTLDDSNLIYGFSMNWGYYISFMFDGNEARIIARYINNDTPTYFVRYLGFDAQVNGLTYRQDKVVTDVAVENFSVSAQDMIVKITNADGSKEQITLDNIVYNSIGWNPDFYYVRALTPKGLLSFSINNIEQYPDTNYLMTIFGIDVPRETPPEPEILIGDVNNDGVVDILDAAIVQKYAAGKTDLTAEQLAAGDVNGDNSVDILDATQIQKYAAGKITEFKRKSAN